jgi:hypothetical protein
LTARPTASADLVWSLIWIVFGAAVIYGAWTMDRLEALHINPYTAPGLIPGALGIGLLVMGVVLLIRSLRSSGAGGSGAPVQLVTPRLLIAAALCIAYGVGLVGRGLPFWLATTIFVFVGILVFRWPEHRESNTLGRGIVTAFLCAAGTAAGVTLVFQELFLVRLP